MGKRSEGRRLSPYFVPIAGPKRAKEAEPLEGFVAAVRAMLASPEFEAVLDRYKRHGVSRWDRVRYWIECIAERCGTGVSPSQKQRELCNHYLAKSGGKGVRCWWTPCYFGPGADDRAIEPHLKGLAWLRRKLATPKSA